MFIIRILYEYRIKIGGGGSVVYKTFKHDKVNMLKAALQIRVCIGKLFSLSSSKTYVVGTQKNRLNETVLLSTQNTCFN